MQVERQAPEVTVQQPPPQVTVTQPKPDVTVKQPEPQVTVQQAKPDVTVQQPGQAQVQVQRPGEPQVTVRQQGQAGTAAGASAGATAWYEGKKASDLVGKEIRNAKGQNVGEIDEIVVNPQTQEMLAVVSVGGFLGMGEKDIALPFDQLRMEQNELILMSEQSETELKQMPAYKDGQFRKVEGDQQLGQAKANAGSSAGQSQPTSGSKKQ